MPSCFGNEKPSHGRAEDGPSPPRRGAVHVGLTKLGIRIQGALQTRRGLSFRAQIAPASLLSAKS